MKFTTQTLGLASLSFLVLSAGCHPGSSGGNDEQALSNRINRINPPATLSESQMQEARILDGVNGRLVAGQQSDVGRSSCPSKLSKWKSAIGFHSNHKIVTDGIFSSQREALSAAKVALGSPFSGFVCAQSNFYNVTFRPGAPLTSGDTITFTTTRSGAQGYQSAIELQAKVGSSVVSSSQSGSSKRTSAKIWYISSIKLVSKNNVDSSDLRFQPSFADLSKIRQNLGAQQATVPSEAPSHSCSNGYVSKSFDLRFKFDNYSSTLARLEAPNGEKVTFATEVKLGSALITNGRKEQERKRVYNTSDQTITIDRPGTYTFAVTVPDYEAGDYGTESTDSWDQFALASSALNTVRRTLVQLTFRINASQGCTLNWASASRLSSEGYTLELK